VLFFSIAGYTGFAKFAAFRRFYSLLLCLRPCHASGTARFSQFRMQHFWHFVGNFLRHLASQFQGCQIRNCM